MPIPRPPLRPLKRDESGVASAVGTIMALLVFLTFLSLIVNQYVPVWMKDAEAAHMSGALGQFGGLKSGIDLQILAANAARQSGSHYIPVTLLAPITLGVDGVPLFAGPTTGDLFLLPDAAPWTIQFSYDIKGVRTPVDERSSGQVLLDAHNRYFVQQTLAYESGAVIRSQSGGQAVRVEPSFEVTKTATSVQVAFTLVSLFGTGSVSGSSTDGVSAKLLGVDSQDYTSIRSSFWINHTTPYGIAWYGLFNDTLARALGVTPKQFATDPSHYSFFRDSSGGQVTVLRVETPYYQVRTNWSANLRTYFVALTMTNDWKNVDPLALEISAIIVQHAYVNAAVGAVRDVQV